MIPSPVQTTLTHAEPAHPATGGFPAALERTLWSLHAAAAQAGLEPRGKVRARVLRDHGGHEFPPTVVGTLVAGVMLRVTPPRTCTTCGAPEDDHPYRHPFAGMGGGRRLRAVDEPTC